MADPVSIATIRTTAEDLVASVVGSTFKRLAFHDIALNDDRSLGAGYSVQFGTANQIYEIHQVPNLEQSITVTLTKKADVRNDDAKAHDALEDLYEYADSIVEEFVVEKMGIPETVYFVNHTGTSDPVRVGGDETRNILALTMSFRVKYVIA